MHRWRDRTKPRPSPAALQYSILLGVSWVGQNVEVFQEQPGRWNTSVLIHHRRTRAVDRSLDNGAQLQAWSSLWHTTSAFWAPVVCWNTPLYHWQSFFSWWKINFVLPSQKLLQTRDCSADTRRVEVLTVYLNSWRHVGDTVYGPEAVSLSATSTLPQHHIQNAPKQHSCKCSEIASSNLLLNI